MRQSSLTAAAFTIVPRFVLGGQGYVPPSDKITLGFLGTGKLSPWLGEAFLELEETQMLAACDVDTTKLMKFKEMVDKYYKKDKSFGGCDTYTDFRDMFNREDIDAYIIALPDHWHAIPAIAAMNRGKHIYCEKPLAHTIEEGRAMVDAARGNNVVLQTGSMQRSWEDFRKACELVRNGYIGEISEVKVNVGDPAKPCDLPNQEIPDSIQWDRWIGPAEYRGYHADLSPPYPIEIWPKWRDYKEFGGGILSDWGAHMFDIAQWGLDMDASGPVEFTPPEDPNAVRGLSFTYENGIKMVHEDFGRGWAVRFIGSEGSIDISRDFFDPSNSKLKNQEISDNEIKLYRSDNHYQDWIDCIKSGKRPVADVEIGHRSASVCNIANIAYELGRPLKWDPVSETFIGDQEANKMRGKTYRKPYLL